MHNHYERRPPWNTIYDEEDDTPPVQKWLRSAWMSLKHEHAQGKTDVTIFAQRFAQRPRDMSKWSLWWISQRIFSVTGLFVAIWLLVLYRGESAAFNLSVAKCKWSNWEQWPQHANPHRLIFVADPQLVDPHTYPGRPWPLSTLTVKHSDLYMRRAYSRIQQDLFPDTIVFLGDLFDGGREWSTATTESVEERYHAYGEAFWQKEYGRFSRIFLHDWRGAVTGRPSQGEDQHIRIIASLPGNHDLGFGQTIQLPVRERFNAFFGESNRIDLIGNHTFISLDTVSLSAMDDDRSDPEIWHPAHEFLENAKTLKAGVIEKHLQHIDQGMSDMRSKHSHVVEDIDERMAETDANPVPEPGSPDIPTILLTHVPLDRPQGKPCGPLRERWPPTPPPAGQLEPLDPDDRNSLPSHGYGWQYQNALSTRVSKFITDSLGGSISYAFSGDDHDFCEVVHKGYSSPGAGIKEITVKSLSWTMGVRKPGFLLASLWNEIDSDGRHISRDVAERHGTIQTHLCLLPDQISILIGYATLLGVTLPLLALHATYKLYVQQNTRPGLRDEDTKPLLPTTSSTTSSAEREKTNGVYVHSSKPEAHSQASSSSSDEALSSNVSARNAASTRPRSVSPLPSYGFNAKPPHSEPLVSYATNRKGWDDVDSSEDMTWNGMRSKKARKLRKTVQRSIMAQFGVLFAREVWHVVRVVLIWYAWLIYR